LGRKTQATNVASEQKTQENEPGQNGDRVYVAHIGSYVATC